MGEFVPGHPAPGLLLLGCYSLARAMLLAKLVQLFPSQAGF